jgi:hypothetical protein
MFDTAPPKPATLRPIGFRYWSLYLSSFYSTELPNWHWFEYEVVEHRLVKYGKRLVWSEAIHPVNDVRFPFTGGYVKFEAMHRRLGII